MTAPVRPTEEMERLYDLGPIEKLRVSYTMTSSDTCDEDLYCNSAKFSWDAWKLLDVNPGFPRSIARLKPQFAKQVEEWRAWLTKNKRELAQYERLKKKFGDIDER